MSEDAKKPVWKENPVPECAIGRPDKREFLACPTCGEFVDTGDSLPSMYKCAKCGQLMNLDDVLDEILTTLVELSQEEEETPC